MKDLAEFLAWTLGGMLAAAAFAALAAYVAAVWMGL